MEPNGGRGTERKAPPPRIERFSPSLAQIPHLPSVITPSAQLNRPNLFPPQAPTTMDLGEVHSHDDIALFNLRWQRYVSWASSVFSTSSQPTPLTVSLERRLLEVVPFNDGAVELHDDIIQGGVVVRFFHLGTKTTLHCSSGEGGLLEPLLVRQDLLSLEMGGRQDLSYNLWELEHMEVEHGGRPVDQASTIRIRNIATNSYLTLQNGALGVVQMGDGDGGPAGGGASSAGSLGGTSTSLDRSRHGSVVDFDALLFRLSSRMGSRPRQGAAGLLTFQDHFQIQHVVSGRWISRGDTKACQATGAGGGGGGGDAADWGGEKSRSRVPSGARERKKSNGREGIAPPKPRARRQSQADVGDLDRERPMASSSSSSVGDAAAAIDPAATTAATTGRHEILLGTTGRPRTRDHFLFQRVSRRELGCLQHVHSASLTLRHVGPALIETVLSRDGELPLTAVLTQDVVDPFLSVVDSMTELLTSMHGVEQEGFAASAGSAVGGAAGAPSASAASTGAATAAAGATAGAGAGPAAPATNAAAAAADTTDDEVTRSLIQGLCREQDVMGLVLTTIMCLFDEPVPDGAPVLEIIPPPAPPSPLSVKDLREGVCPVLRKLIKSIFSFGTAFCDRNAANQVAMKPYVEWLSTLNGNKLNGSEMLTTIFKDNRALILDVDESQIRRMLDLLSTHGLQMQVCAPSCVRTHCAVVSRLASCCRCRL